MPRFSKRRYAGKKRYPKRRRVIRRRPRRKSFRRSRGARSGRSGRYSQLFGDNFAPSVLLGRKKTMPRVLFPTHSSHFITYIYTWDTAKAISGTQNMSFSIDGLGRQGKQTWNLYGTSANESDLATNYDNYQANSQTAPYGVKKIYFKGTAITLKLQNAGEAMVTVRITFVKLKPWATDTEWNWNVHQPLARNHFNVLSTEKFVIQPIPVSNNADVLPAGAEAGNTYIERKYYMPWNRYVYTNNGDYGQTFSDWQKLKKEYTYMLIESDDATITDGETVSCTCTMVDYWCSQDPKN